MKRLLVLALVCLAVVSCKKEDDDDNNNGNNGNSSTATCSSVNGYTAIPDTAFEKALIDLGHDDLRDGQVLTINISSVTGLIIPGAGISDLTGIECFTALNVLACPQNQLTSLDLSQSTALFLLECYDNQLTSLDLSENTALNILYCGANQLTSLDLSQNTALQSVWCMDNQLTSLDLSQNTAIKDFDCIGNQLECLNIKNGNNTNFIFFNANSNPNLTCIEVDDPTWATQNWTVSGNNIDNGVTFSTNCNYPAGCF